MSTLNPAGKKFVWLRWVTAFFLLTGALELTLQTASWYKKYSIRQLEMSRLADGLDYSILTIGDSMTRGIFTSSYPDFLQEKIRARFPDKKIVVTNRAVSGFTSQQVFEKLSADLELTKPNLVVLMAGVNDPPESLESARPPWWHFVKIVRIPAYLGYPLFFPQRQQTSTRKRDLIKRKDTSSDLIKPMGRLCLPKTVRMAAMSGAQVLVMQYPLADTDDLTALLASVKPTAIISNRENFSDVLRERGYNSLFHDVVTATFGHTTALGDELFAENVWPYIERAIARKFAEK